MPLDSAKRCVEHAPLARAEFRAVRHEGAARLLSPLQHRRLLALHLATRQVQPARSACVRALLGAHEHRPLGQCVRGPGEPELCQHLLEGLVALVDHRAGDVILRRPLRQRLVCVSPQRFLASHDIRRVDAGCVRHRCIRAGPLACQLQLARPLTDGTAPVAWPFGASLVHTLTPSPWMRRQCEITRPSEPLNSSPQPTH
eukprot:567126-Prymnesium_polylepis.1